MIRTPENQNGQSVAVLSLDCADGRRLAFAEAVSSSTGPLPADVYYISATASVFLSVGVNPTAGDIAGSIAFAGGSGIYLAIGEGERIAAMGASESGSLFITPAK